MRKQGIIRAGLVALLAGGMVAAWSPRLLAQDGAAAGGGDPVPLAPASGTCTFNLKDAPIESAVKYVQAAAPTDISITVSGEAQGERVTLSLRNSPWREALEEIARTTGCSVEDVSSTLIRVEKPQPVTMFYEGAPIDRVIRTIAAISGANIVSDPKDVEGTVSVNLRNVPWRKALNSIVGTKGFHVVEEPGGILRVVSAKMLKAEIETQVYQFKYLRPPPDYKPKLPSSEYVEKAGGASSTDIEKAFSIIGSLRKALEPEGALEYINNTNSLVLKGTKPKLAQVMSMLRTLDREPQQLFVDMQFISTTNRDFFDIGAGPGSQGLLGSATFAKVDGAIALPFKTGEGGWEEALLIKKGLPKVGSSNPTFSFGSLDFSNTSYLLRLLRNDSKSRIVQAPKIYVLDNQEATIFVGESIRYAETSAAEGQAGGLTFSIKEAGASPVSVGFQLLLVPHVIPETNRIIMTLVPTQNSLSGASAELPGFDKFEVGGAGGDQVIFLPRESSSTLVTTLVVEHGTTAVIGGLMQDTNSVTIQKVPYLGDIPLLGWLFKTEQRSKTVQQLMIFMTPYLIKDAARQREAIAAELLRREPELDTEWERLSASPAATDVMAAPAEKVVEGAPPSPPK